MAGRRTNIGVAPDEGRITDEAVAAARAMIGQILRPEGPYLQDATPDTLRNFCNGIGDLNPLYRELEHGRESRAGSIIAHPNFGYAFGWPGPAPRAVPGGDGFSARTAWGPARDLGDGRRTA